MIYLHKVLPALLSPLMLIALLLGVAAWRRCRWAALGALALLLFFSIPLTSALLVRHVEGYALRQDASAVPTAQAIVVLSGMLDEIQGVNGVVSEWADPDRFFAGLELYKAGKAPLLVFTGEYMPWTLAARSEGEQLAKIAKEFGVAEADLRVTGAVQNTADEARAVRALLPGDNQQILLVTSAFHMTRAAALFRRAGFTVIPYPVDFKIRAERFTPMDLLPSTRALGLSDLVLREWLGQIYTALFSGES